MTGAVGPVLSSLVSVLWSRCPLHSTEHLSSSPLLCVSGRAPCSQLTAQLTAPRSSLLCWLPAPANSASLSANLVLPQLAKSVVRDKLLLGRDGYEMRLIYPCAGLRATKLSFADECMIIICLCFCPVKFHNKPDSQLTIMSVFVC